MNCPQCGRGIFVQGFGDAWRSAEKERLAREYERNFYDSQQNFFASVLPLRVLQKTLLAWRADVPGWFEPQSEWEKMP